MRVSVQRSRINRECHASVWLPETACYTPKLYPYARRSVSDNYRALQSITSTVGTDFGSISPEAKCYVPPQSALDGSILTHLRLHI